MLCETHTCPSQAEGVLLGLQGLDWYTKGLKEDRDGDVASEFLEEPSTPSSAQPRSTHEDAAASLKV